MGDDKLYVRGVTYGPFRPEPDGSEYHDPATVEADFARMAASGVNAVRTYTPPPPWLLDAALRHGLRVMIGLPWEQHVTFLDDPARARRIEDGVRRTARAYAGHPALLCFSVGNEIPAPIVRWHGRRRVERFLARLYRAVKAEDPGALVTYVNFPTTEYLHLPFLDFVAFNVYLEHQATFDGYLARLQTLAGERPLVMAEIGLDSRRNGEDGQAASLDWQIRTAFAAGCAGAFAFAWTDEWHRGGHDIDDWDFGLTDRDRRPKPALEAVRDAFAEVPFPAGMAWPKISVVVCSYNGAATIAETLAALECVEYPDYEVIVVDDGSTDATAEIASAFSVRLIRTENRGLSAARNTGMEAARGEIVVYLDDDAYPDPQWLTYYAAAFAVGDYAAVGGPNVPPPGDGLVAAGVARAPGNPTHVLLTDRVAEHVPGCNMAVRKSVLQAIGGFDPVFRIAGDDVDVCWRIQAAGGVIGFAPAALVWHHRRRTVRTYWRQQRNYGRAEALLEAKWPEKYNAAGHVAWGGLVYGTGAAKALPFRRWRVYHGVWGSRPFQSLYERAPGTLLTLPLMPEWLLVVAASAALALAGLVWPDVLPAGLALLALSAGALLAQAAVAVVRSAGGRRGAWRESAMTFGLHLLHPLARLSGRIGFGLHPWRHAGGGAYAFPAPRSAEVWDETWTAPEERLEALEGALRACGARVRRGGDFDRWDIEVVGGLFGGVRVLLATEEHGGGRQLARFRLRPRWPLPLVAAVAALAVFAIGEELRGTPALALAVALVALMIAAHAARAAATATGAVLAALRAPVQPDAP